MTSKWHAPATSQRAEESSETVANSAAASGAIAGTRKSIHDAWPRCAFCSSDLPPPVCGVVPVKCRPHATVVLCPQVEPLGAQLCFLVTVMVTVLHWCRGFRSENGNRRAVAGRLHHARLSHLSRDCNITCHRWNAPHKISSCTCLVCIVAQESCASTPHTGSRALNWIMTTW
jgi:hypothetical protein